MPSASSTSASLGSRTVTTGGSVVATPDLKLLVMPAHGPAPLDIQALALGAGPGAVCKWDFGDGVTATGALVSHTYQSPGAYTVTLTAGTATKTATVTVD